MKNSITILFLTFFSFSFSQENNNYSEIEVKYKMNFILDTLNSSSKKEEIMILLVGKNSSYFYSYDKFKKDSAITKYFNNAKNSGNLIELNANNFPTSRISLNVYDERNNIMITDLVARTQFTYAPEKPLKWLLSNDRTKIIEGYKCNKASTILNGRKYIAWYTSEIPFNEGPYRFKGLPGLILEISDEKKWHEISMISILKTRKIISAPLKGIPSTQKEFINKRKEFRNDPAGVLGLDVDKNTRETMYNNVNRKNNFLE